MTQLMDRLQLFLKNDYSSRLWKKTHYPVVETLRDLSSSEEMQSKRFETGLPTGAIFDIFFNKLGVYVQFLKDTCVFYKKAIENLQKKHSFTLQEILGSEMIYLSKEHRAQVLAG